MPKLRREVIRVWLEYHNCTVRRLTVECNALTKYGDGILYGRLVEESREGR